MLRKVACGGGNGICKVVCWFRIQSRVGYWEKRHEGIGMTVFPCLIFELAAAIHLGVECRAARSVAAIGHLAF